ncbi:MAG: redoxin domain-containing protein [Opitutales bacterium]|nr:redoxin domain-containing protein [Opitutales bacterium]
MISVGQKIDTSISLKVVRNGDVVECVLADLLDRPTIVSVYMRNNTSACDLQNKSLVPLFEQLLSEGVNLIALSKDSCGSHKKYADKLGIRYTLASDPDKKFAEATDSLVEKSMYGKKYLAPSRSAYFIHTDGTVLGVIEKLSPASHAEELLQLVHACR